MTDLETVELGEYCEDLMKQENFNKITKLFEDQTLHNLLNTRPDEKDKREAVYASFNGVRDFMGLMLAITDMKNAIIEKDNQAPSGDDADALDQD